MAERIPVRIGPAPDALAGEWIENRQAFIAAVRHAGSLSVNDDALELLDTFLGLWSAVVGTSDTFEWSYSMDADVLLLVAKYWLELGRIPHDERARIGVVPTSLEAEAFTAVVVAGMVDALRLAGPRGAELLDRLRSVGEAEV